MSTVADLRDTLRLALPLCVAHLGQHLMGVVDTAVLGHYSDQALAGAGIANSLLFTFYMFGVGVIMGLDTLVPQALGAGERRRARRLFWQGARLAVAVGIPLTVVICLSPAVLPLMGVEPEVANEARTFLWFRVPGVIPMLVFIAQRSYLQAMSITRPLVLAIVAGNVVNLVAAYLLVFGDPGLARLGLPEIGLPPLGAAGAGLATSAVSLASLAIGAAAIRSIPVPPEGADERPASMRAIWNLGLPVGLHLLAEVGVFGLAALLAGRLGKTPAAAHQVAISLASFSFSMALGVGAATSVRVGRAVGGGDSASARRAGASGLLLGMCLMGCAGIVFVSAPGALAGLFSREATVIAATIPLLQIAALFQLSDSVQAVAAGALRGAGDTRSTFIGNLLGHYAIGFPISVALAFGLGWGAPGLWTGLSAGLTAVAIALSLRFFWLARRPIRRV